MKLRKRLLYLMAFYLLTNTSDPGECGQLNKSSLENKASICSENASKIKARKDEDIELNINSFKQIESHGYPRAYNRRSGARGLMQIVPSVLKEWNHLHPSQEYNLDDLFNSRINVKIGTWYLDRIKNHYLPHYGIKPSIENIIIAYNWGIGNLQKSIRERDRSLRNMSELGEPNYDNLKVQDGGLILETDDMDEYLWNFRKKDDPHFLKTENREFKIPKNTRKYIREYKEMQENSENDVLKYRKIQEEIRRKVEILMPRLGIKEVDRLALQPIKYLNYTRRER